MAEGSETERRPFSTVYAPPTVLQPADALRWSSSNEMRISVPSISSKPVTVVLTNVRPARSAAVTGAGLASEDASDPEESSSHMRPRA